MAYQRGENSENNKKFLKPSCLPEVQALSLVDRCRISDTRSDTIPLNLRLNYSNDCQEAKKESAFKLCKIKLYIRMMYIDKYKFAKRTYIS